MNRIKLGITANGVRYHDFSKAPHILIAGETGSGKSMMMHNIIAEAVLQYTDAAMVLIDPKMVEFRVYRNNSHLWCKIANTPEEALQTLAKVLEEVQIRYQVLERTGARSGGDPLFVFIDELADLMYASRKETERLISRIAALGRACNVHLVCATQTPRACVVSGMIKANLGTRIALACASSVDSRVILDQSGAELLRRDGGYGIYKNGLDCEVFRGYYVPDEQIEERARLTERNKRWWERLWCI